VEGLAELAFRRHHAQIVRYLSRRTGDLDRAEDIAQDVFLDATVALSADGFVPDSLPAWLQTIAKRRFADDARRRRLRLADPAWDGSLDELSASDGDGDDRRAVIEAIMLLNPGERGVIVMRLIRGCSFKEIACSLEVSEAAAKMRFQRALAVLRRNLEQHGVAP
jgi:RNA polymerase sigma-70 factor (ECF subfamily)